MENNRLLTFLKRLMTPLVPPSVLRSPDTVKRKVQLTIYYSVAVQVCTWSYIAIDILVLGRFPPQRPYSMALLGLNILGLIIGRLWDSGRIISVTAPLSMLGMVTIGSLSNGGIFGPIPSCFALLLMVTIAMTDIRVGKIFFLIIVGILGGLVALGNSPIIAPLAPSAWTYFMIDIVMLLTTYWFFSMYENEQERLRSIAFEHQQLKTISKMIATLNHEINTPLNSSLIAIQMLQAHEKRSLGNSPGLGSGPSEPWVDLALQGLRQIQEVIKQIAEIEPEKLVEVDYHSQTPSGSSGKIYKVNKKPS